MFKIYYKNKILLISKVKFEDKNFTKLSFFDETRRNLFIEDFLFSDNSSNLNVYGCTKKEGLRILFPDFKMLKAAGGLVLNNKQQVLIISRLGYVDLPKGKLKKNESLKQCAIREVCEECGILDKDIKIVGKIGKSYHIYKINEIFVLKQVVWYKMKFSGDYELTAQKEENIDDVYWQNIGDLSKLIDKTYFSLKDIFLSLNY